MKLVAFLGNDSANYGQLTALMNRMECDKIVLIKDNKTTSPFADPRCAIIDVDSSKDLLSFKQEIQDKLRKELVSDFEVALTIASGNGKEHMALISALLSIPVGIKLTAFTKQGVEFLS